MSTHLLSVSFLSWSSLFLYFLLLTPRTILSVIRVSCRHSQKLHVCTNLHNAGHKRASIDLSDYWFVLLKIYLSWVSCTSPLANSSSFFIIFDRFVLSSLDPCTHTTHQRRGSVEKAPLGIGRSLLKDLSLLHSKVELSSGVPVTSMLLFSIKGFHELNHWPLWNDILVVNVTIPENGSWYTRSNSTNKLSSKHMPYDTIQLQLKMSTFVLNYNFQKKYLDRVH